MYGAIFGLITGAFLGWLFAAILKNRSTILGDQGADGQVERFRTIGLIVLGAAMGGAIGVILVGL